MVRNFEERGLLGRRPAFSPGLTRRIEYIQQQADELFMLDVFLTRIRADYVAMLAEATGQLSRALLRLKVRS